MQRQNHFVPQLHLKRFADERGETSVFRTLVSRDSVREWKSHSIRGIANYENLYTRFTRGAESDDFEKWFCGFEHAAAAPIEKAVAADRLTPSDWEAIIRFAMVQTVRTPAYVRRNLPRWQRSVPDVMERVRQQLEEQQARGELGLPTNRPSGIGLPGEWRDFLPFGVSGTEGIMGFEVNMSVTIGRQLWLADIKHAMELRVRRILEQKWSIYKAPPGVPWFTSDDPVVVVRFDSDHDYVFCDTFDTGTEIMMPLDPKCILYARIGEQRPRLSGTEVPPELARRWRRLIAEHADQMIFSASEEAEIPRLRPRQVDEAAFKERDAWWRSWHKDNLDLERELPPISEREAR